MKWPKWNHARISQQTLGLIVVLTVFFAVDDVLMFVLMQQFEVINMHGWLYYFTYALLLLGSLAVALLVVKALQRHPVTGCEGLQGARGEVVRRNSKGYQVEIAGEIWQAVCHQELSIGDAVRVESVDGLNLTVRKEAMGASHI